MGAIAPPTSRTTAFSSGTPPPPPPLLFLDKEIHEIFFDNFGQPYLLPLERDNMSVPTVGVVVGMTKSGLMAAAPSSKP